MVDLDAMDADPWPTWPVDKNELRGLVDEIERLRERRDDWRAAMTDNHDLWDENARLRAAAEMALETLIGCCVSAGGVDDRKTILEAQDMLRAALGEAFDDAAT